MNQKIKLNKFKLLEQMEKCNIDRDDLAFYMGISKQVLYRKIKDGFSKSEICLIQDTVGGQNLIDTVK